jgi:hypothetical protein
MEETVYTNIKPPLNLRRPVSLTNPDRAIMLNKGLAVPGVRFPPVPEQ